jgi:hypothetical protein
LNLDISCSRVDFSVLIYDRDKSSLSPAAGGL